MFRFISLRGAVLGLSLLTLGSIPASADSIFNFESTPSGTKFPLSLTNNGITASFVGSASVCASGGLFATLSGNVAIQSLCGLGQSGPLSIAFSKNLSALSFDFATAGGPGSLSVKLFENGVGVGSQIFNSVDPAGRLNGEGFASLSGTFNSVTLTGNTFLAADNLDAVATVTPEPATIVDCLSGTLVLAGFLRRRGMAWRS